ncbi:MAG: T9SS type A sorting domain-containing protein, partial [Chitinophagales bacterium]
IIKKHQSFSLDVSLMPEITSIEDRLQKDGFLLYPNPAKNTLFLKFEKQVTQIELFDITGKIIRNMDAPQQEMTLDISDLETGIYWVKAIGMDWSGSQKVVIGE